MIVQDFELNQCSYFDIITYHYDLSLWLSPWLSLWLSLWLSIWPITMTINMTYHYDYHYDYQYDYQHDYQDDLSLWLSLYSMFILNFLGCIVHSLLMESNKITAFSFSAKNIQNCCVDWSILFFPTQKCNENNWWKKFFFHL